MLKDRITTVETLDTDLRRLQYKVQRGGKKT